GAETLFLGVAGLEFGQAAAGTEQWPDQRFHERPREDDEGVQAFHTGRLITPFILLHRFEGSPLTDDSHRVPCSKQAALEELMLGFIFGTVCLVALIKVLRHGRGHGWRYAHGGCGGHGWHG